MPVVLSEDEVRQVLSNLLDGHSLAGQMLYGSGVRLMEALLLRIKDGDVERSSLIVRDGKGDKDRITVLPESLKVPLKVHLTVVLALQHQDLSEGWGRVVPPDALAMKYFNADREWGWHRVCPQSRRWRDRATGAEGRHHLGPSVVQKALKKAVADAGVRKAASCHTFRHSFATHLL